MESERVSIDKLEGVHNWSMWKFQMRQILEAAELFDYVDGTTDKPIVASVNYAKEVVTWKKADAKARRTISIACGKQSIRLIMNCETAKEMWTALKSTYEQKSENNTYFLQQKYYNFKKEPSDDMATFISKLLEIVHQLRDQEETISDSMVISKILNTMPAEYSHFNSAWESASAADRTLTNLKARLMAEEMRLKSQDQVEEVEALMAKRTFPKKTNNKKGISANNKNKSDKPKGKCFKCGKGGHWKRDCPESRKQSDGRREGSSSDAFVCCTATSGEQDTWILDSGATDHMSYRREWFENFTEICPEPVTVGNGEQIMARGKGDINILAFGGNGWIRKRVMGVLFVPELRKNLFSSGKVTDRGHQLNMDNKGCELLRDGNIVAVGVRRRGLFQMLFRTIQPSKLEIAANVAIKKTSLRSWHERLGHQNATHVKKFLQARNIDFINESFECEACIYGKHHRSSFKSREEKSKKCGEIIHTDVCGPFQENSIGGSSYFLLLKDDYSHFRFVYFMKQKSEVAEIIKKCVKLIQRKHGHSVRIIRSDNGTEFVNNELKTFFEEAGIHHQRTVPYTPEQNGCAEREMRTIVESARTMLQAKQIEKKFWAEAVNLAVHVLNRSGTSTVENKSPYELWHGEEARLDHLRVFGSEVFIHIPKEKRQKLDSKAAKCVFVGYDNNSKGYRVWNPKTGKIEISRDVVFLLEESMATLDVGAEEKADKDANGGNASNKNTKDEGVNDYVTPVQQQNERSAICDVDDRNVVDRRLRDRSTITATKRLTYLASGEHFAMSATSEEPRTYEQAIQADDRKQWERAMDEEYDSLIKNRTWTLVKAPDDQRVIDNRWVYKVKRDPDGSTDRYKARLVVRGFTQEYGIDYHETFSPVVKFTSIRAILALAAAKQMKLKQFDVKTAFLNGDLEENVYMSQPIGYDDGSGRVCKLLKSLYGLKQASRCWNRKFTSFVNRFGFRASKYDPCVFVCNGENGMLILAIYVDDGLVAAEKQEAIEPVIKHLQQEFEIKVFELKCFLGLEIDQRSDGSIHAHQQGYARKVLNRFNMTNCNAVSTPLNNSQNLGDFEADEEIEFPYREAVGSLMYLAVATRPDISFAVGSVSRYLEKPAAAHVNAVKRILKYVRGTMDMGIRFESGNDLHFCGYSDADYAGDVTTRRSTSGYVFMLGGSVISWGSERQKSVALSTTESEYMAASHAIKELIWLRNLLGELLQADDLAPILFMDNQSAIRLVKNPEFHKRTKHIDVRYHFIREKFEDGIFEMKYVQTDEQAADIMTKALQKQKHQFFCELMSVMPKN